MTLKPKEANGSEATPTFMNSFYKILTGLISSLIIGNFVFLWNVNKDLAEIRILNESQKTYEERSILQLEQTNAKVTEGLNRLNTRLDAFDNRITTLEVIIGLRGKGK